MSNTAFCRVAASVFGIVAIVQAARLVLQLPVQVGSMPVPMAASWFALLVAGGLSVWGFRSGSQ